VRLFLRIGKGGCRFSGRDKEVKVIWEIRDEFTRECGRAA
jgi:hypothetical protein